MASPVWDWLVRHRSQAVTGAIVLCLAVIVVESFLLYQQRSANRAIETQSAKLLTTFLQGDTLRESSTSGVPIRLENVRFKWSDRVYIDTGNMAVRAVPIRGTTVNFDDLESFVLTLQRSVVTIRPDVLEGMFNESVFNYPESHVRNLKVELTQDKDTKEQGVRLKGDVNVVTWLPFKMDTRMSVDKSTNTLVIDVVHLKLLGFVPATGLLKMKPFHLDKLISLPPNKSLMVSGNRMMVKPFGLFPPPRINGTMTEVTLDGKMIQLGFAGAPIQAPQSEAKNYVYLRGGSSQFGHFRMLDTDILIVDRDQGNSFVFSLAHYADMIPKSVIAIHDTKSVRVTMPDF